MKLVIFGLTISSSWGNGHATLWRGLCRALHARGHEIVFFERDTPYYAAHRDLPEARWCDIVLYDNWNTAAARVRTELATADVAMVTSYCPDGAAASKRVVDAVLPRKVYYDLDSPVTLDRLSRGERVEYLPESGLRDFDVVLSYAGGAALGALQEMLGARVVAPLYGSVDPEVHHPVVSSEPFRSDLSYLGTYAADRDAALQRLLLAPARRRGDLTFAIAGSQYPDDYPWLPNIKYLRHLPPSLHPELFCSSALTLNVTRAAMASMGYCPSGRLFEAAACGTAIVSDRWDGLDQFYAPGEEILLADDTADVLTLLDLPEEDTRRVGTRARERTLDCHTARERARELERLLEQTPDAWPGAA